MSFSRSDFVARRSFLLKKKTEVPRGGLMLGNSPFKEKATAGYSNFNYFEALQLNDNRASLPVGVLNFRAAMMQYGRNTLSGVARYLYHNYGMVSYAVNQIANYSVPLTPQAMTRDTAWNQAAEDYFSDWAKIADRTGRFHFDTLQRLICKHIDIDGDIGIYLTSDQGLPKVQMVEGWRIGQNLNLAEKGAIDGVLLDVAGAVTAYRVYQAPDVFRDVPVNEMFLAYDPDLFSSYRGFSPLRRGMNDVRDASEIKAFEKLASKLNASLAGIISGAPMMADALDNDPLADSNTLLAANQGRISVGGADIPIISRGSEFKQADTSRPNMKALDFIDALVGHFVAGLDIPPAFFLDAKLTGPNARSVNGKAQRKFNQRQKMMEKVLEWVWVRVIAHAIDSGALPVNERWEKVGFQKPSKISIDQGRESQQERSDVETGLMTRDDHFGNRGQDWHEKTKQISAEIKTIADDCKRLSKETAIPYSVLLSQFGIGTNSKAMDAPGVGIIQGSEDEDETPGKQGEEEDEL